jgi:hypothetical protein
MFTELNTEIDTLCSPENGLYAVQASEVTYNSSINTYDVTGTATGGTYSGMPVNNILRVLYSTTGPSRDWPEAKGWRPRFDADPTTFPSSVSIELGGNVPESGRTLRIVYSTDFSHFTDLTTTCSAVGLSTSMEDLPTLGAAMKLAGIREVARNFTEAQGDTRRASEVPPNAQRAGYAAIALERQRRIRDEAMKLTTTYPPRRAGIG